MVVNGGKMPANGDKYSSDAEKSAWGLPRFFKREGKYFSASSKATSGAKKADTLPRVGVDELPNASPQDGANKDVRVENDHLSGIRPSRGDAAP